VVIDKAMATLLRFPPALFTRSTDTELLIVIAILQLQAFGISKAIKHTLDLWKSTVYYTPLLKPFQAQEVNVSSINYELFQGFQV